MCLDALRAGASRAARPPGACPQADALRTHGARSAAGTPARISHHALGLTEHVCAHRLSFVFQTSHSQKRLMKMTDFSDGNQC